MIEVHPPESGDDDDPLPLALWVAGVALFSVLIVMLLAH